MGDFGISGDAVLAQTSRVLGSPHFSRSQTLSRFLRFAVDVTLDGKEQELKEYRLGVDVFGRGEAFDPRVDPIVRIQAAKLRARLAEYYSDEGRNDCIVISIPKGGYVPCFTLAERPASGRLHDSTGPQSIAVLPFVSLSADPENEHFSDGLTEELINVLTYVPGLRVVARTSVFCFKNAARDVREIGAQLNVQTVLEGSVRKSGDQLRVTAQLIDVSTGYHLVSRTYPRKLQDVFLLQEELAAEVVAEIMPRVRAESPPVVRSQPTNLTAYNLYLRGMSALANRYSGPQASVELFRKALEHDPGYAPAWAGLASAYFSQAWFFLMRPKDAMPMGKEAALRALKLDQRLGQAHASAAMIQAAFEYDWHGSEKSFRKAIQLQPSLSMAHHFYSILCLQPQGRYNEAVAGIERALLLDPFDVVLGGTASLVYAIAGDFESALRQYELAAEVNPAHPLAHVTMGLAYEMQGRFEESVTLFRKACVLAGRAPVPLSGLGHALAGMGEIAEAKAILRELLESPRRSGYALALTHEALANKTEAIRWLKFAFEEREPQAILISVDPRLASIRSSPEVQQLLGEMGLPRSATA